MKNLFEYSDVLKSPIEAFYCDSKYFSLPVESHWHYFIEILYVSSGNIDVICNEQTYHLSKGSVIIIPPQAIHSITSSARSYEFRYLCIKFNLLRIHLAGDYLPDLFSVFREISRKEKLPICFCSEDFPSLNTDEFFERIHTEIREKEYGYDTLIYSMLSELLTHLLRIWYNLGISVNPENGTKNEEQSIQDVLLYIDHHSQENINIENLASMCHMSYSYFAKLFKKHYGRTCKEYIEFVRVSKAENLILYTDYDLTYIAEELGFADCSHLIRVFKKHFGKTPGKYRKELPTPPSVK